MLPRYRAIRFIKVLEAGRTSPLLLECELVSDQGDLLGNFVVKAPGLPEVTDYELFIETVGYLLAAEFGIETPQPAIVTIDADFVNLVNPLLKTQGLSIKEGVGFGSELIAGGVAVTGQEHQNPEQADRARDIFCYDLVIQNPDRLPSNPNCLLKAGRFVAFDFNMAFSFLVPIIGRNDEPWEFSKHQIAQNHVFLSSLRGKTVDFRPFIYKVVALSEAKLNQILSNVPFGNGQWDERLRAHMMTIVENADRLEIEFARCIV